MTPWGQTRTLVSAMASHPDIQIETVRVDFESHPYRSPLSFGGTSIDHCVLLNVHIEVRSRNGGRAEGFGSMTLGNIWSFPPRLLAPDLSLAAMRLLAERMAAVVGGCGEKGHALELVMDLWPVCLACRGAVERELGLTVPIPELCALVVFSPFDAALHDAYGKANSLNSYDALGPAFVGRDLSHFLDERFAGRYLDACTSRAPRESLPLYHLVGGVDALTEGDLGERLGDGRPETLEEWIRADGLSHLKIKLKGDDLGWDVTRVLDVDRVATDTAGPGRELCYSLDFNERCENVEYLLAFFERVREERSVAFERIAYVEQPTDRDLRARPENVMHRAAAIKPVVIDESLTDYESLLLARELGYSGVALKACKGQSQALLMAAAAREFGMYLTVQDLTCAGAAFLQTAELAARIPQVAAVEGNARQFCPDAHGPWAARFPEVFEVRRGMIRMGTLTSPGLGHG